MSNNVKQDKTLIAEAMLAKYETPAAAQRALVEQGIRLSMSALYNIKLRMGGERINTDASEYIPWELKREHRNLYAAVMLRALAKRHSGAPLTETTSVKLDRWLKALTEEDAVIHYSEDASFVRVPRRKAINRWHEEEYIDPPWIRDPRINDDGSRVEWTDR